MILEKPTVADLIAALQTFPADTPVIIVDADTQWTIDRIHIEVETDGVNLFGEYHEMHHDVNVRCSANGV